MKTTGAVLAGFALWSVLWNTGNMVLQKLFPDKFEEGVAQDAGTLVAVVLLSVLYSLAAGYLTALIDGKLKAAWILGALNLAVGVAVQIKYAKQVPVWYHVAFLVLLVPAILGGAKLRLR